MPISYASIVVVLLSTLFQTVFGEPIAFLKRRNEGPPPILKPRSVISGTSPSIGGFSIYQSRNATSATYIASAPITTAPITTSASLPNDCYIDYDGNIKQDGNFSQTSCTGTKTIAGPPLTGLLGDCVLWDKSCNGNRTNATSDFYETELTFLQENSCFVNETLDCKGILPDDMLKVFPNLKDWMRSEECDDGFKDYQRSIGNGNDFPDNETSICCNTCYINADDVDIYYWPVPNADTSCLNIIGDKVDPPLYGATTDANKTTYWGCTPTTPLAGKTIITTARMTSIGSVTFKQSLFNPWSGDPCGATSVTTGTSSAMPVKNLQVRGHSLIASASGGNGSATIVTTNGFTL